MNKKTLRSMVCVLSIVTLAINASDDGSGCCSNSSDIRNDLTPMQSSIRKLRKPVGTFINAEGPEKLASKSTSIADTLDTRAVSLENIDILRDQFFAERHARLRRKVIKSMFKQENLYFTVAYLGEVVDHLQEGCSISNAIQRASNHRNGFDHNHAIEALRAGTLSQEKFMKSIALGRLAKYMHKHKMLKKSGIVIPAS